MSKASNLAKGGVFTALTVIFIYLSTIVPTNRLYLLALASCIIPLSIMTTNVKNSFIIYFSSSILSFLLGLRGGALVYAVFFGLYGFVKYYTEKLRKPVYEIILKLVFFNIGLLIIYNFYTLLFLELPKVNIPIYYAVAMLQVIFFIFDYALTVFVAYVNRRFISKGHFR